MVFGPSIIVVLESTLPVVNAVAEALESVDIARHGNLKKNMAPYMDTKLSDPSYQDKSSNFWQPHQW